MAETSSDVGHGAGQVAPAMDASTLWADFGPPLRRFLARRLPPGVEADDLVQEVFVRVVRNLGSLRGTDRPEAWLFQIARNALRDALRVRVRRDERTDALEVDPPDERGAADARAAEVEFLKGTIEAIPLPDQSVDVIISNCVINLSEDKDAVLREAFRVLKPGGRFAVSDVVLRGAVPAEVRRSLELWVGCVAGALPQDEYAAKLKAAGFADVDVEPWRIYQVDDARAFLAESGVDVDRLARDIDGKVASAFVRARKPEAKACCGPTCCA